MDKDDWKDVPHGEDDWQDVSIKPEEPSALDFGGNLDRYKDTLHKAMAGDPDAELAIAGKSLGLASGGLGAPMVKSMMNTGEAAVGKAASMAKDVLPAMKDIPWDAASDVAINAMPVGPGARLGLHTVKGIAKRILESRAARLAAEKAAQTTPAVTEAVAPIVEESAPAVREVVSEAVKRRLDPFTKKYLEGAAKEATPIIEDEAAVWGPKYDPFLKVYR